MPFTSDQETAAQTNTELLAAPGAGRQYKVTQVHVACVGAIDSTVTLESGDDTAKLVVQCLAEQATHTVVNPRGVFTTDVNETLTYTTTGTNPNVFVQVQYEDQKFIG